MNRQTVITAASAFALGILEYLNTSLNVVFLDIRQLSLLLSSRRNSNDLDFFQNL